MRLFRIRTPESEMYVVVHSKNEQETRTLLEEFASNLGVNPLGIYFTEIETYHLERRP